MALNLQAVDDPRTDQNFREIGRQFPIQEANVADGLREGVRAEEDLKTTRGIINTAGSGSIVEGSGFSIVRNAAGDITITFTSPFSGVPTVTGTAGETAGTNMVKHNSAPTKSKAQLVLFNTAGATLDGILHFTAIGPR